MTSVHFFVTEDSSGAPSTVSQCRACVCTTACVEQSGFNSIEVVCRNCRAG